MLTKDIQSFFKAVRVGDVEKVSALIQNDKAYVTVCSVSPPKKDEGQSALQVALKAGNFAVARLLIEAGGDVDFVETSTTNEWRIPVLHDAIRATIFSSYTLQKDSSHFDDAFAVLELLLSRKANVHATDSFGNNSLHRAILDSRQMINSPDADLENGVLLLQLRNVFKVLIAAGADKELANEKRPSAKELIENFRMEQYHLIDDR